ncbi:MAG: tetraacyldisaccharide 4'-kinase [Planctomycetota bacterium]
MLKRFWESAWLRLLLKPLGWGYGSAMALRRRLYDQGYLDSHRFSQPVISVGNLTVGGTGKTPVVSAILDLLPPEFRPALVLARGYGASFVHERVELNDEGHLLRSRHPNHLHVQGADRVAAALRVVGDPPPAVIVLDDGAQHLQIQRDVEILLFDARSLLKPRGILPAGPWRESLAAARGADALVLTRTDRVDASALSKIEAELSELAPEVPVFRCRHVARDLVPLALGPKDRPRHLSELAKRRVGLVSGIADPNSFADLVQQLGASVSWHESFPDHYLYHRDDLDRILAHAEVDPVDEILVTEKDRAKLAALGGAATGFSVLRIDIDFGDDGARFASLLEQSLKEAKRERT